ncbi:MAG: response regulator transcription factor [Actinobacteria bacterium]|nr:MAG: response regulator transcription factor [Actinomycetota bacterium]
MSDGARRTVVLVDQHPLWTAAVERIVGGLGMEVLGRTASSSAALELLQQHECDVLVTDITMPSGEPNGIELTAKAVARVPSLKVIVLTSDDDPRQIDAAFRAGAVAYVVKTAAAELRAVIQQVFSDSIFLPSLLPAPAAEATTTAPPPRAIPVVPTGAQKIGGIDLTPREVEILQLVAQGLSNAELADRLWVSEQTVKFHLSNVYRKLHVESRAKASRWAAVHGLLAHEARDSASPA